MRVFVTDGENRAALAVTRSLGRAGHEVIVGEKHVPSLAQTSRYCSSAVAYPDPTVSSERFIAFLAAIVRDRRVDVLMPVSDITTLLVTGNRDAFGGCAVPFASADVVRRAADKVDVVKTAMRLGIPVPHSIVLQKGEPAPLSLDIAFPLVVKPARSRVEVGGRWVSTSVSYAADWCELERDLAARPAHEFPVMLQERIVGPGLGVFACYHDGRPIALFSHRRLRERPPWGGVGVLAESTPIDPAAREYSTRLLDELGWHGVAMVEFKQDPDGVPRLMEINGRFWGSLQLAVDAGVDFPGLLVHGVSEHAFGEQPSYRIGIRNRWFWGDVDALLVTLFGGDGAPSVARPRRIPALVEFMKLWGHDLHYENPKWQDLRPGLFETARWFRRTLRDARSAGRTGKISA